MGITRPCPDGGVKKKRGITRPRPDGGVTISQEGSRCQELYSSDQNVRVIKVVTISNQFPSI